MALDIVSVLMDYYIFRGNDVLAHKDSHALPDETVWRALGESNVVCDIFSEAPYTYTGARLRDGAGAEGYELIPIRSYFGEHDESDSARAARAKGMLAWRSTYKFCPSCGGSLIDDEKLSARNCTNCGAQYFPRIEPCIIVLVTKGDKLLLARHRARSQNIHTCIAGFIEIGESAEQAVVREVREEVGIEIKDLRYVGSQGWPFPDQLMLGFRAEYASGDIRVQESELVEAKWFTRDALPPFPKRGSMGWRLITGVYG